MAASFLEWNPRITSPQQNELNIQFSLGLPLFPVNCLLKNKGKVPFTHLGEVMDGKGACSAYAAEPDPIFALIEEHGRAYAAVNVEVVKTDQWEAVIPEEKRKTLHVDEEVFETDDPRWLTHKRTLRALFDAECALADIVPKTTAGVCAILKDGVEVEERGSCWKNLVDPDDESVLHRRIALFRQPQHRDLSRRDWRS